MSDTTNDNAPTEKSTIEQDKIAQQVTEQQVFWDAQQLKSLKIWYVLALIGFILAVISHQPVILLSCILTFLIGIVPELWFRFALRHLLIQQNLNESHVFFGEDVVLSLTIENRKFLPVPWLKIEDTIHPPLTTVRGQEKRWLIVRRDKIFSTWLLWSYQRVTHRYRLHCYARGFHICGPIKLTCSDPFGWLERDFTAAINQVLLVYPLITPIESLRLPAIFPMGDNVGPRQLLEDPLWFAGNRQYQSGDDPRRIDWKATARTGELRSKIYESTIMRRLLVVLDVWVYAQDVQRTDFELQEYCISAATSLAMWGLDEGYMVSIFTNCPTITASETLVSQVNTDHVERRFWGSQVQKSIAATRLSPVGTNVPFSADNEQYEEILTTMARLVPQYHTPIEYMIEQEQHLFTRGTTVLFVGAANTLSTKTVEQLQELSGRGNAIHLILAEEPQAGESVVDTYNLPVHSIGGREKWRELVASIDRNTRAVGTSTIAIALD